MNKKSYYNSDAKHAGLLHELLTKEEKAVFRRREKEKHRKYLVNEINRIYHSTEIETNHKDACLMVDCLTGFVGRYLRAISNSDLDEIYAWMHKWTIKPGKFEWGVDWSGIKAEGVSNDEQQ